MKKHFLRILVVMLMACLGIGVLAACGDGEEETPPETTYTVQFSLGESHAAEGVTAPASQTGKKVGDTVTLTTLNAAEDWKFDGWSAKSGKVSGTTYTVKAADAVEGTITLTAQWAEDTPAPTTYTVEFNAGTHGTVVGDATYTEKADGASITVPAVTANKGYTFSGWKIGTKAVSGTYTVAAADATSGKITITAEYTPITYTVTFVVTKPQGATTEVQGDHDSTTITIEDNTVTFPTVTLTGYNLTGWKLTNEPSESLKTGASYAVTAADLPANDAEHAITFTAQWAAEGTYTVSFNAGTHGTVSGTATFAEQEDGASVTVPTVTANKGYTFTAWKLGNKTVSGTYTVSAADADTNGTITITAEYTAITYTVHFVVTKPQGATGEVQGTHADATITIENNTVTFPTVTLEGYDLAWKLGSGNPITTATYDVAETELPENSVTPHEITFTAQWTPKPVTANDYVGVWTNGDDTVTIMMDADGQGGYAIVKSKVSEGVVVVTVKYYIDYYTLTKSGNGFADGTATFIVVNDTLTVNIKNIEVSGETTYTETTYTKSGSLGNPIAPSGVYSTTDGRWIVDFTNKTWNDVAFADDPIDVGGYKVITVTTGSGFNAVTQTYIIFQVGTDYYATSTSNSDAAEKLNVGQPQPQVQKYEIVYGGTGVRGIVDELEYEEGGLVNITTEKPERWGWTFAGWELAGGDSDVVYGHEAGQQATYTVNPEDEYFEGVIRFNAKWTIVPVENRKYTVTFEDTSGEGNVDLPDPMSNLAHNAEVTIPEMPGTRGEHRFLGWTLDFSPDNLYVHDDPVRGKYYVDDEDADQQTGVITFMAVWDDTFQEEIDITGVWTTADGSSSVTILYMADYSIGGAVVSADGSYTYYELSPMSDGYSGSGYFSAPLTATFTPNAAGDQLTVSIDGRNTTYTHKTDLGDGEPLMLTGTYTMDISAMGTGVDKFTLTFTDDGGTINVGDFLDTGDNVVSDTTLNFTTMNIGDYLILQVPQLANIVVYKDGNDYYASFGMPIKLTPATTEPEEASDYVGVWTKGADDGSSVTIALDEDGETLHAVVYTPATEAPTSASYAYYKLTADENGFTGKALNDDDVTFALQGDELTVTIGAASTTYTGKTVELPEAITIEGIYTFGDGNTSAVIDFASNTIDMGQAGGFLPVTFVNVGNYLVSLMTVNAGDTHEREINFVIYEDSNEYYVSVTGTAPMELTPLTFTATGYTEDTPLYFYGGGLKEGEVLTFRGDMKFTGSTSNVKYGILGYLSQGNYLNADTETKEYIACRLDYYFYNTAADKGKVNAAPGEIGDGTYNQGVLAELKWNLSKLSLGFTVGSDDWFAAYNAMIAQANTTFGYELEYDYSMAGVVFISYIITTPTQFTYTFNTTQVTVPAGTQFIVRYGVEPYDDGNLDNLVVAIGGEQATLTNISISKTEPLLHFHKKGADDACEICGKTLTNGAEQTLTLTNNDQRQNWMQHIANQTTGTYTATANTELHVTGEFGTVGADWEGFAIVVMETTSKQGLFCQYSSGSCRNSNWTTWVGAPWNLEKRTVNGGFTNLDTLAAATKSGHKFELVLTYDGTLAKLAIITYADDNGTAADTRIITFNIEGSALAIGIGFDGTGGNTDNVKNVKYYTVTATDPAPAAD